MFTDPKENADGPAIKCPGHPAEEACEDYPDGACTKCNEVEDARLATLARKRRKR